MNNYRAMLEACELYYNHNMSQTEIAAQLGLSRPTVKGLLLGARERGLVKIIISDLSGRNYLELERRLEQKLGLKEAIVVDSAEDPIQQKDLLAQGAAGFLESILQEGNEIGVSMGTALARIPPFITMRCSQLTFVPLVGGIGDVSIAFHSNNIAEAMAKAFHAESLYLHAPSVVTRAQTKRELLKEAGTQRTLSRYNHLDIAIMGIGNAGSNSAVVKAGYLTESMLQEMQRRDICGDICMCLYDRTGDTSGIPYNEGLIGIDIHQLCKIPYSIGVAGTREKVDAIRGAIQGKFINVLVTDCVAAGLLCE